MRRLTCALLGLAVLHVPARAAATSCSDPPWERPFPYGFIPDDPIPVDGQLWQLASCGHDAMTCTLVNGSETISVEYESFGTEICDTLEDGRSPYGGAPYYIRRFVPVQPLTPGAEYTLECDEYFGQGSLTVRDDDTPAAAPPKLAVEDSYYSREHNGCCGYGDVIEIRFADMDADYLQEGGYIEATYPDGQAYVLDRPESAGHFVIPGIRDVVRFVPVSASGERGEPFLLSGRNIDGDLVYVACAVSGEPSPLALWLLVPFVWIAGHRVRRSRRPA